MARKRIKIEPIQGERSRTATFQKRKVGLFKKAHELAILTSSNVAVIIFNENGRLSEFCSSNMEDFLLRYADYRGIIDRQGPEHFTRAEPHSRKIEEPGNTPCSCKGDFHSANSMQTTPDNLQRRRFSSDSRSSMDNSPQTLPFPGSFSVTEHGQEATSPSSVPIPPKIPHTPTPLDLPAPTMSLEESHACPSNAPELHQVIQQGNHMMHPSITRMPNGRMVPGIPAPLSHDRRWSSAQELGLSSQVSPLNSSFDDRRFSATALSCPPNHGYMGGDISNYSRAIHSPVEQNLFGPNRSLSLGSSYPPSHSNINMTALGQASDFSSQRSSFSIPPAHSQTHSLLSSPVTTTHGCPGNHPMSNSVSGVRSNEAMDMLHMKMNLPSNDSALQNMSNPRILSSAASMSLPVFERGQSGGDAPSSE